MQFFTTTSILAAAISIFGLAVIYFKWSFAYWGKRGVPNLPPTIPFGNFGEVVRQKAHYGQHMKRLFDEFKKMKVKYGGLYVITKPCLLLVDLDVVKSVLAKDFQYFTGHGNPHNEEVDPFTGHLFGLEGRKWKELRLKLSPAFTSNKIKIMFDTIADCSKEIPVLLDQVISKNGGAIDIKSVSERFTIDVIGSGIFGLDCNSLKEPNSEFRTQAMNALHVELLQGLKALFSVGMPELANYFRIRATKLSVIDFFTNIVRQTIEMREMKNIRRNDLMQLLMELKLDLNIQQLAAQFYLFFLAGFETSAATLSFLFHELVHNPDVQKKVREEVRDVLDKHDGKICYAAITEMTFMEQCVKETLRKYPPLPVLSRECTKTYKMPDSDLIIEKGTLVFVPILAIHNDPEYYPNPEKFEPDRFDSNNKTKIQPYAWLPFGEGPRICIANRLGMVQIKMAITALLRNHQYIRHDKTKDRLEIEIPSFIMKPKDKMWIKAERV